MQRTVATWQEFGGRWDGPLNFLLSGECLPFAFDLPPLAQVVEELRQDPGARITPGTKGPALDLRDIRDAFLSLPLERALASPFALAHFQLTAFDAPGRFLDGFHAQVLAPWQEALRAHGFTWTRCYPIVFVSGAGCATNYHLDFSHVLAWQRYGTKRFCGLKDPDRWVPRAARVSYRPGELVRPAGLTAEEVLCYEMTPGRALWNALLTPHWVEASEEVALSINISHGGLRRYGALCPYEQELEDARSQG